MEVGLFVHGNCFMYRIGPTFCASCDYGINRCSTPQLVYIQSNSQQSIQFPKQEVHLQLHSIQ